MSLHIPVRSISGATFFVICNTCHSMLPIAMFRKVLSVLSLTLREGLFRTLNVVYHFSKSQVPNSLRCVKNPTCCLCLFWIKYLLNTLSVYAWKNVTTHGCMNEGTNHTLK